MKRVIFSALVAALVFVVAPSSHGEVSDDEVSRDMFALAEGKGKKVWITTKGVPSFRYSIEVPPEWQVKSSSIDRKFDVVVERHYDAARVAIFFTTDRFRRAVDWSQFRLSDLSEEDFRKIFGIGSAAKIKTTEFGLINKHRALFLHSDAVLNGHPLSNICYMIEATRPVWVSFTGMMARTSPSDTGAEQLASDIRGLFKMIASTTDFSAERPAAASGTATETERSRDELRELSEAVKRKKIGTNSDQITGPFESSASSIVGCGLLVALLVWIGWRGQSWNSASGAN